MRQTTVHVHTSRVLYSQRVLSVPTNWHNLAGVLVHRDTAHSILIWSGKAWHRVNNAGWVIKFRAVFPVDLRVGHWAILAPLPLRRNHRHMQTYFDHEKLTMALHCITETDAELVVP